MSTQKYLYILTCFISGAALMVIEMSGIRLLAPVFGSSTYTWTALIAVVLIGLSIGGYIGGYIADKTTSPSVVITMLVVSAAFIIVIPALHAASNGLMSQLGIIYGPTILSITLFLIPGTMLGAINPYVTRLLARLSDDKKIGSATGSANTASALGSLIGTLMAGFYLVPYMDVRNIFLLSATILVVLAGLILFSTAVQISKRRVMTYGAVLFFAVLISSAFRMSYGPGVLEVTNSQYQQIMVYETDVDGTPTRLMINNGQPQGSIRLDTMRPNMDYQTYWKIIKRFKLNIDNALMIGGGTFGVPQGVEDTYPNANITVVEIDKDVTGTAMRYFNLDKYPSIKIITSDARWYSNNDDTLYDFIYVDAYNGNNALPSHLATVEYFKTLKMKLAPEGLVMMNVIGNESGKMSSVFGSIYNTFSAVFGDVSVYRTPVAHKDHIATNLMLLASVNGTLPKPTFPVSEVVSQYLETLVPEKRILVDGAPILTDHNNPLDAIASKMNFENQL